MKNESLYRKTVDILYDAYFNDTLIHNTCYACAVGNIIAANMGTVVSKSNRGAWSNNKTPSWSVVLFPCGDNLEYEKGIEQINSTGYSVKEIKLIERAFETVDTNSRTNDFDENWMFDGLVAVLEVLKQIHEVENNDTDLGRFKKHYQCKTQSLNTR